MAKASNTINGKAFEFACLVAVYNVLHQNGKEASFQETPAFVTAKNAFVSLDDKTKHNYLLAAITAILQIKGLEPQLLNGEGSILLEISPDAAAVGANGDVRDVLCVRSEVKNGTWEIGMSCKHNHDALKHPRITEKKDFGMDWVGIPCSEQFLHEITPIIEPLIEYGKNGITWNSIKNKDDNYYVPILSAYLGEIKRMCENAVVPAKLLSYFFGSNDFYKVIMNERKNTTVVEGFNIHGTLNKKCGAIAPTTVVNRIVLPQRLIEADFKRNKNGTLSKTTIILIFDGGWTVAMRLHNKDDIAKPTSLAWDVKLIGLPTSTYNNTRSWFDIPIEPQLMNYELLL